MPITRSAKKKLRQDHKREKTNTRAKISVREAIKKFRKNKSEKLLNEAFSLIDRALKKNIFHKNKAGRLKSSLSKLIAGKKSGQSATKPPIAKKAKDKTPPKKK